MRDAGVPYTRAAKEVGLQWQTARRFEQGSTKNVGRRVEAWLGRSAVAEGAVGKIKRSDASKDDFDLFRRRYFGRVTVPWHRDAAQQVVSRQRTRGGERRFLVVNVASGSGKTTLLHDLVCWLLVRDRSTRILLGARSEGQAEAYLRRVRRSLERTEPVKADPDLRRAGMAADAVSTLASDFGTFRVSGDLWSASQIVVSGAGERDEKEPSVAAYGADSAFLGGRYDVMVWDDVVDKRNLMTPAARDRLWEWWTGEAETRLEPGGVMLLVGQRMGADDLYRRVRDVRLRDGSRKYELVRYPAHFEELCVQAHDENAAAWPAGCLLDPKRLPWASLDAMRSTNETAFRLMMQQEDVVSADALVKPEWVYGGTLNGETFPGCVDENRAPGEVPPVCRPDTAWSVVTADPSPSNWWAVQWWGYHYGSRTRFLLDQHRTRMSSADFLSWDWINNRFAGVLEEWWQRASDRRFPLQHVIVEGNAAQKFLLQQSDMRRWMSSRQVTVVSHQTASNKADPRYGVHTIGTPYKYGQISLPWSAPTRHIVRPLVDELLTWPDGQTDDCVMAQWFMEYSMPRIAPRRVTPPRLAVPSALLSGERRGVAALGASR